MRVPDSGVQSCRSAVDLDPVDLPDEPRFRDRPFERDRVLIARVDCPQRSPALVAQAFAVLAVGQDHSVAYKVFPGDRGGVVVQRFEGFYWTVAQYQIAHHRLKGELRAIAAGEPANTEELGRRATVFASKASILTEPSEVKSLLNGVPGFAEATNRVAELQHRIGATLEKEVFTQADAISVLGEF